MSVVDLEREVIRMGESVSLSTWWTATLQMASWSRRNAPL